MAHCIYNYTEESSQNLAMRVWDGYNPYLNRATMTGTRETLLQRATLLLLLLFTDQII